MLNLIDDEIYFIISDAVLNKNFKSVFEVTDNIYKNGWSFVDFIDGLVEHFRNIMTVVVTKKSDLVESADIYKSKYLEYKNQFSEGDLLRLLNFLNKGQQELKYSQNHKLKLEIILTHLVGLERSSTISELFSQLVDKNFEQPSYKSINESKDAGYNSSAPINRTGSESKKTRAPILGKSDATEENNLKASSSKNENEINSSLDFNFDSIVSKWQKFVDEVSNEKRFTLGHFIGNVELLDLNGSKLSVNLPDEDGKKSFKLHKDYIEKKFMNFFGKRIILNFSKADSNSPIPLQEKTSTAAKQSKKEKAVSTNEPVVDAIIRELGGKELA